MISRRQLNDSGTFISETGHFWEFGEIALDGGLQMSRGDWVTTAATLVIAGITYFVGGANLAWLCIGLGAIIFLIVHFLRPKSESKTSEGGGVGDILNPSLSQTGVTVSPVIAPVFHTNYNPPVSQPLPETPKPADRLTVDVKFAPWQGQFDKMYLTVTNQGPSQTFEAECRIVARRNDPNPQQLRTYNLQWQHRDRASALVCGKSDNLLIASAGDDRVTGMEWMRLEAAMGEHGPDSHWLSNEKLKPEYDIEIKIFGDKSDQPQVEQFTVRAGNSRALEMFRRHVRIVSPSDGAEVAYRHIVNGIVSPPDATVQVYLRSGNGIWYHQGDIIATAGSWEINCWFGNPGSPLGSEYEIEARSNGNIQGKQFRILPSTGTHSNSITVRRTRN